MNKIKLASRILDNGDEIVEVIIPETRIFVTVSAYEREHGHRPEKIAFQRGRIFAGSSSKCGNVRSGGVSPLKNDFHEKALRIDSEGFSFTGRRLTRLSEDKPSAPATAP